jgi:CBS domain containing-hemolysin-like protein
MMPEPLLPVWPWAVLLVAGMALAAIASATQAALAYVNRARLRRLIESAASRSRALAWALDEPTVIFTTATVLTIMGVGGVAVALFGIAASIDIGDPWTAIGIFAPGFAALLLTVAAARATAVSRPDETARVLVYPLAWLGFVAGPLVLVSHGLERMVVRALGRGTEAAEEEAAEDELRRLVESVDDNSALEEDEREMLHGIFEISERVAREVMVPRIDIRALPSSSTVRDVLDKVVESGYSRIPIFEGSVDHIVGIVYAKDMLRHLREGKLDDPARPIARVPKFVPETKKVDGLLQELQKSRVHMVIIVDEYGGTAGLLTIEDLLEEIVGEIQDEYDNEDLEIEKLSAHEAIVDARATIRDVNEALDLHFDDEELDTFGGLVYHELGKIPEAGETVRIDGCIVTVLSTQGRRLRKLQVTRVGESTAEEPA